MTLHELDTRKCANPECRQPAEQEVSFVLADQKTLHYCGDGCKEIHKALMLRHVPDLVKR